MDTDKANSTSFAELDRGIEAIAEELTFLTS